MNIMDKKYMLLQIQEMIFKKNIVSIIDLLCRYIEEDDTDTDIINSLIYILRKGIGSDFIKQKIIDILKKYTLHSNKIKAKNIFLSELEILEEKYVLQSMPRHITVELLTKCNLKCVMCGFSDIKNKYKYSIISDEFISFIRNNIPYFERITWQGGEPFLYPKIYELIYFAIEKNIYQQVSTNLLLVDENKLDLLCDSKLTLFISIDGVDKETYEKIRIDGSFDSLIRKLDVIKKYKKRNNSFKLVMAVVLLSLNYHQIDKMIKFAIEYSFDEITFQEYINVNNNKFNLYIEKDKLIEVKRKLVMYKNLYTEKKLPIIVNTSLNLTGITCVGKEYNVAKDVIDDKKYIEKNFDNNDSSIFINITNNYDMKSKMFCYAPWTNLCLYTKDEIKFTCSSVSVIYDKIKKEIWNNDFFVNYRKLLLSNNLSLCVKDCSDKGDQGSSIKLGI